MGIYGLIAFTTARRTSEIGIRMALGATQQTILAMVLRDELKLITIGVALGLLGSALSARLFAARLYGIGTTDPIALGSAVLLLIVVAGIAGYLPARRAAAIDPIAALRSE